MEPKKVNIDFNIMQKAVKAAVRAKALQFGSSIIYLKDGILIEENPRTNTIKTLNKDLPN